MSEEVLEAIDELVRLLSSGEGGEPGATTTTVDPALDSYGYDPVPGTTVEATNYGYDDYGYETDIVGDATQEHGTTPSGDQGPEPEVGMSEPPVDTDGTLATGLDEQPETGVPVTPDGEAAGWEYDSATGIYGDPASDLAYDPVTGVYYDSVTGGGYDPVTGMVYDPATGWTFPETPPEVWTAPSTIHSQGPSDPYEWFWYANPDVTFDYGYGVDDAAYHGDFTSVSAMTGESPAETQTYEDLIYQYGFQDVPGILSDSPIGVYEGMYGSVAPIYGGAGPTASGWNVYDYYGADWYGGQPIEHDYLNPYPDFFGPGSMPQTDPTLFPDSHEVWSPHTATF